MKLVVRPQSWIALQRQHATSGSLFRFTPLTAPPSLHRASIGSVYVPENSAAEHRKQTARGLFASTTCVQVRAAERGLNRFRTANRHYDAGAHIECNAARETPKLPANRIADSDPTDDKSTSGRVGLSRRRRRPMAGIGA